MHINTHTHSHTTCFHTHTHTPLSYLLLDVCDAEILQGTGIIQLMPIELHLSVYMYMYACMVLCMCVCMCVCVCMYVYARLHGTDTILYTTPCHTTQTIS
ncbi:hypothetical protein EON63_10415 [archaeon]|nr:MAG: hypothetical protein EON63_10415 [archaeon]